MMRLLSLIAICVTLGLVGGAACTAGVPGAAVFVRLAGTTEDARSDVFEQRLAGEPARLLISHTALPKSFRGRIERALPSQDGALILLQASDGGCWLWSRRTGKASRLMLTGFTDGSSELEPLAWSPRGKLLLIRASIERKTSTAKHLSESLCLLDAATGRTRTLHTTRPYDTLLTRWTSDGTAVLVIGEREGDKTSLELVSLNGKVQRLFALPSSAFNVAISPDGHQVAIGDTGGYFLSDRKGRARRKLALPVIGDKPWPEDRHPQGDMIFSPDGNTLAVLVSFGYGHGEGASLHEEIWTVQTKTAEAHRLAQWNSGWAGDDDVHELLGWMPSQSGLLLMSQNQASSGPESDYRKLWLQPVNPAQPARLLANTGPRGIDISW